MERCRLQDVPDRMGPATIKKPLTDALGARDVALNYYELAPGDSLAFGYHRHPDQEELFYVLAGAVTFETESGPVIAAAEEVIRFDPGEWQRGRNDGEDRARVLAIGAPRDAETEMLRQCPSCGGRTEQTVETVADRSALRTRCLACDTETGRFE
jgi:uncharacterized cupin superfamily protein